MWLFKKNQPNKKTNSKQRKCFNIRQDEQAEEMWKGQEWGLTDICVCVMIMAVKKNQPCYVFTRTRAQITFPLLMLNVKPLRYYQAFYIFEKTLKAQTSPYFWPFLSGKKQKKKKNNFWNKYYNINSSNLH